MSTPRILGLLILPALLLAVEARGEGLEDPPAPDALASRVGFEPVAGVPARSAGGAHAWPSGEAASESALWLDRVWFDRLPLEVRHRAERAPWPMGRWQATAALGAASIVARALLEGPDEPRWRGGVLFDEDVRGWLRAGSDASRQRASDASDLLVGALWAALLVDTALVRDRERQTGLWLINADAILATLLTTEVSKYAFGRERPNRDDSRGFFSGHASGAATAAGLLCAHHLHGELYGGGRRDRLACGAAVTAAVGVGVLRLRADRHYASDVLAAWGVGFLFGYFLPSRWYYLDEPELAQTLVLPRLDGHGAGLMLLHRF